MTAITICLPNSVHQKIKELAARDDVSVNQFIASVPTLGISPIVKRPADVWIVTSKSERIAF